MKAHSLPRNRHNALQEGYVKQLGELGPFVEGSLCKFVRPGRKSASWHLTYKVDGKTQTVYVPVGMVEEVRRWTEEYKHLKELIRKETKQSLALIHSYAARRRAADRKPASTQD